MTRKFDGDTLLIATHNAGKAKEFQQMIGQTINIKNAADFNLPDVEETGTTYLENARLKAIAGANHAGIPALADDSGFGLDALNGKPGLHTARYMKQQGGYAQAFDALEKELKKSSNRKAFFTTALCLAWPDGHVEEVKAIIKGRFIYPARGDHGFGYDPVFMCDGYEKTFGELPNDQKNPLSSRGTAIKMMLEKCFS